MKKILTLALAFSCGAVLAQKADNVGIGTTKPDPSAILDLNSNSKGLLLPRMNQAQRDAIKNPAAGLIIFQTDQVIGTYTFDGTAWQPSSARVGGTDAVAVSGAWDKQGNDIDATDFLGTKATSTFKPLIFKVNGAQVGKFDASSNILFGNGAGNAITSGTFNIGIGTNSINLATTVSNLVGIGQNALQKATGTNNVAIGGNAGANITSGTDNLAIGTLALYTNSTGTQNTAFGTNSLLNVNGQANTGFGFNSLLGGASAAFNNNIGIGAGAGQNHTSGDLNVFIGAAAGQQNVSGVGNVFIGGLAGNAETGSNKLYIANSSTANPLLKGDFSANWVKVNSKTTGYLAVGDFDAGTPMPTPTGYRLIVQDGILTEKLKVALRTDGANWADYVFEPSYKLMPLEEVEKYTKTNKHLPNVPSADEITKEGIDVAKVSKMFMEKIEELTLHIIELNKRIKELETKK